MGDAPSPGAGMNPLTPTHTKNTRRREGEKRQPASRGTELGWTFWRGSSPQTATRARTVSPSHTPSTRISTHKGGPAVAPSRLHHGRAPVSSLSPASPQRGPLPPPRPFPSLPSAATASSPHAPNLPLTEARDGARPRALRPAIPLPIHSP